MAAPKEPAGELDGKVALVTGGSSGIGLAFAKLLRAKGARLIITGRDGRKLEKAMTALAPHVTGVCCDFSGDENWYAALEEVTHGFRVDILINNAGYNPYLEANCLNTNAFDVHRRFVDAMLTAYLRLCHACLPHMIDNEYGRASPLARARDARPPAPAGVVNVASVASHLTSSMESKFNMYGAVKGAVAAFSTALRRNLLEGSVGKACGVHVTAACPGSVPTALARDAPRSALAEAHAAVTPDALKWGLASTPEWTAEAAWRAVSANRPYAFNSRMDKLIAVVMHLFTLLHVLFYS